MHSLQFLLASVNLADPERLDSDVYRQIRRTVEPPLMRFAEARGKRRWAEKSPSNADHGDLLLDVFPDAEFICLYRHPMDVIVSGIETCKWGFSGYGFEPYVRGSPDNFVRALGGYWIDRTRLIHEFESNHPDQCCRVYYECLVTATEATLKGLCSFVELAWEERMLDVSGALAEELGPGDHKAPYAEEVYSSRVGVGCKVPTQLMSPPMLAAMSGLAVAIGYPPITDEWDRCVHPLRVVDAGANGGEEIVRRIKESVGRWRPAVDNWRPTVRFIFDDLAPEVAVWTLDTDNGTVISGGGSEDPDVVAVASTAVYESVAKRQRNIAEAMRAGDLRLTAWSGLGSPRDLHPVVLLIRDILHGGSR